MSTWTEQLTARAAPATVLGVLTDPRACGRWAPIDFEVRAFAGDRLRTGSRARVAGQLAGREVGFDIEVLVADEERLALVAHGPIAFDVEYRLRAVDAGSELRARVVVRGRGLAGRVLAQATGALMAAGALRTAMASIAREAEAGEQGNHGPEGLAHVASYRMNRGAGAATSTRSRPAALAA